MNYTLFFLFALLSAICCGQGSFAPAPGLPGSTAIKADSSILKSWATHCEVFRGYIHARDTSRTHTFLDSTSNRAFFGTASNAVGNDFSASGAVSLGDHGIAILQFENGIGNGDGPDFAVFENGFKISGDSSYFLELAFVEVSSNGTDFYRFPATSETQTDIQIRDAEGLNPSYLNNLAGKYPAPYGVPFDLEELSQYPSLNLNRITHVKVIDVGGMLGNMEQLDANGTPINDPFPTPYYTGGFDLAAVGVIHENRNETINSELIYPNPVKAGAFVRVQISGARQYQLYNFHGEVIGQGITEGTVQIPKGLEQHMVILKIFENDQVKVARLWVN